MSAEGEIGGGSFVVVYVGFWVEFWGMGLIGVRVERGHVR